MKLTKIHRILKSKQSCLLKEYVEFNTEKRKEATDKLNQNFFKLLINSIYGKTMENERKRISVRLINNAKDYVRCVSKPNFVSQKLFSKNFITVHQIKPVLALNKQIYAGFSILELSKFLMYKFYYEYVKNKYDAKLLLTDTGSLVYEIKGKYVYEECFKDREWFDFSDYSVNSKFFESTKKQTVGNIKDKFKGEIISEFVGLKSKMCSLTTVKDQEVTKAKGVYEKIKHEVFVDVLFNRKVVKHNMKRVQSKLHSIGTYDVFKISLFCFDDKRYVLENGVNTPAYFHKNIKNL